MNTYMTLSISGRMPTRSAITHPSIPFWPEMVQQLSQWGRVTGQEQTPTRVEEIFNVVGVVVRLAALGRFRHSSASIAWPLYDESASNSFGKTFLQLDFAGGRVTNVQIGAIGCRHR